VLVDNPLFFPPSFSETPSTPRVRNCESFKYNPPKPVLATESDRLIFTAENGIPLSSPFSPPLPLSFPSGLRHSAYPASELATAGVFFPPSPSFPFLFFFPCICDASLITAVTVGADFPSRHRRRTRVFHRRRRESACSFMAFFFLFPFFSFFPLDACDPFGNAGKPGFGEEWIGLLKAARNARGNFLFSFFSPRSLCSSFAAYSNSSISPSRRARPRN